MLLLEVCNKLLPATILSFLQKKENVLVLSKMDNKQESEFLTHRCGLMAGIFTVAGIIDSFVYHGHRAIKKKMELGKLG